MRIGNVIESPGGGKWIITEIDDEQVSAVSFDYENTSAVQSLEDTVHDKTCHCGDSPELDGEPQADCERCHGSGSYAVPVRGWKHAKVLAPTVKAFIVRGMRRVFKI